MLISPVFGLPTIEHVIIPSSQECLSDRWLSHYIPPSPSSATFEDMSISDMINRCPPRFRGETLSEIHDLCSSCNCCHLDELADTPSLARILHRWSYDFASFCFEQCQEARWCRTAPKDICTFYFNWERGRQAQVLKPTRQSQLHLALEKLYTLRSGSSNLLLLRRIDFQWTKVV